MKGQWIYQVSSVDCEDNYSAEYRCRTWNRKQYLFAYKFVYWRYNLLPSCPCEMWQAHLDPDFLVEQQEECAYSVNPFQNTITQVCFTSTLLSCSNCIDLHK